MFDPSKAEHVYIAIGYTNLRMGIDGLAGIVANINIKAVQNSGWLSCGGGMKHIFHKEKYMNKIVPCLKFITKEKNEQK